MASSTSPARSRSTPLSSGSRPEEALREGERDTEREGAAEAGADTAFMVERVGVPLVEGSTLKRKNIPTAKPITRVKMGSKTAFFIGSLPSTAILRQFILRE